MVDKYVILKISSNGFKIEIVDIEDKENAEKICTNDNNCFMKELWYKYQKSSIDPTKINIKYIIVKVEKVKSNDPIDKESIMILDGYAYFMDALKICPENQKRQNKLYYYYIGQIGSFLLV